MTILNDVRAKTVKKLRRLFYWVKSVLRLNQNFFCLLWIYRARKKEFWLKLSLVIYWFNLTTDFTHTSTFNPHPTKLSHQRGILDPSAYGFGNARVKQRQGFPRALDLSSLHAQKSSGSRLTNRGQNGLHNKNSLKNYTMVYNLKKNFVRLK